MCNFQIHHLTPLLARSEVIPAINEIEVHSYVNQPEVRQEHVRLGILTQAWSPLGQVYVYGARYPDGDDDSAKSVLAPRRSAACDKCRNQDWGPTAGRTPNQRQLR